MTSNGQSASQQAASSSHVSTSSSLLLRKLPTNLPKVQVWRITSQPAPRSLGDGRDSERFGYNSDDPWVPTARPYHMVPPSEKELENQVEYDMDADDFEWLETLNAERRRDSLDGVSCEFFEVLMDRLDKEWFNLQKYIPKPNTNLAIEDSKCIICDDGECESSNAIVFCDGCNIAVHQDCYGVPYIPEGQWLCRKCTVSPDRPVACVLCPNEYGAFKQTTNGKWAHLLCAIWINETGVSNTVYMEPVDGIESIPKGRWKLICYLCKRRTGACLQCTKSNCYTAYHATCAREYGLHMKLGTASGATTNEDTATNISYCDRHAPVTREGSGTPGLSTAIPNGDGCQTPTAGMRDGSVELPTPEQLNLARLNKAYKRGGAIVSRGRGPPTPKTPLLPLKKQGSKAGRAYSKTFTSAGPPVIPQYIYQKVWDYVKPLNCKRKRELVKMVCRYWSLKREARRGAPLLKRLHLEPWTASTTSRETTDLEKEKKLDLMLRLRQDLEQVRNASEYIRKREKEKLRRSQLIKSAVESVVFPQTVVFRAFLRRLRALDNKGLFANPVSRVEVPDYHLLIKNPMDWQTITDKLDRNEYLSAWDFQSDVHLIVKNALIYNTPDSTHGRAAIKLQVGMQSILAELNVIDDKESSTHQLHHMFPSLLLEDNTLSDLLRLWYPKPVELEEPATASVPPISQATAVDAQAEVQLTQQSDSQDPVSSASQRMPSAANGMPGPPEVRPSASVEPQESTTDINPRKRKHQEMDLDQAPGFKAPAPTMGLDSPLPSASISVPNAVQEPLLSASLPPPTPSTPALLTPSLPTSNPAFFGLPTLQYQPLPQASTSKSKSGKSPKGSSSTPPLYRTAGLPPDQKRQVELERKREWHRKSQEAKKERKRLEEEARAARKALAAGNASTSQPTPTGIRLQIPVRASRNAALPSAGPSASAISRPSATPKQPDTPRTNAAADQLARQQEAAQQQRLAEEARARAQALQQAEQAARDAQTKATEEEAVKVAETARLAAEQQAEQARLMAERAAAAQAQAQAAMTTSTPGPKRRRSRSPVKRLEPTPAAAIPTIVRESPLRSTSNSVSTAPDTATVAAAAVEDGVLPAVQVGDVNPHESFTLFNTGWVLPPGTRRNRTISADRGPSAGIPSGKRESISPMLPIVPLPPVEPLPIPATASRDILKLAPETQQGQKKVQNGTMELSDSDLSDVEEEDDTIAIDIDQPAPPKDADAGPSTLPSAVAVKAPVPKPKRASSISDLSDLSDLGELSDVPEEPSTSSKLQSKAKRSPLKANATPKKGKSRRSSVNTTPLYVAKTRHQRAAEAALLSSPPPPEAEPVLGEPPSAAIQEAKEDIVEVPQEASLTVTQPQREKSRSLSPLSEMSVDGVPEASILQVGHDDTTLAEAGTGGETDIKAEDTTFANTSTLPAAITSSSSTNNAKKRRNRTSLGMPKDRRRSSGLKSDNKRPSPELLARLAELRANLTYSFLSELEDREIVWAKPQYEPAWPGEVCMDSERAIPQAVLAREPAINRDKNAKDVDKSVMIHWYPRTAKDTWSWVKLSEITKFQESQEYDDLMHNIDTLTPSHRKKHRDLEEAYQAAHAIVETPEEFIKRKSGLTEEKGKNGTPRKKK